MKKPSWVAFLVILFLLLTGCQRGVPSQENPSQDSSAPPNESAVTEQEETSLPSSEETSDAGSRKEPLQLGERMVSEGSFHDMEERFGPCESYEITFLGVGVWMFNIDLKYPTMEITLYLDLPSCRSMDESAVDDEGFLLVDTLTEEDKNEKGYVREIRWSDPALKGPRDTMIGDSVEDVKAKFLDLSTKYNDGKTIYKLSDVDPSYPSETPEHSVGESGAKWNSLFGVSEEHIAYYANVPPDQEDSDYWHTFEYTAFYIDDGKVSSIAQGYFSDLDRP